jgi:pyrroloquinoline quinone biosynthesis protein B
VSADSERWVLLNASPEIHSQIESFPALHPKGERHSPIRAIVLTNGDLDHVLGLFSLRESYPVVIYATPQVRLGLELNPLLKTLQRFPGQLTWKALELGAEQELADANGAGLGIWVRPVPVLGKPPIHLEGTFPPSAEDNVGLFLRAESSAGPLAYFPAAGAIEAWSAELSAARALLFDGTFWHENELISLGLSKKRAQDMAHIPIGGLEGSLVQLAKLKDVPTKVFVHINNTNPILAAGNPERLAVEASGWTVGLDGQDYTV